MVLDVATDELPPGVVEITDGRPIATRADLARIPSLVANGDVVAVRAIGTHAQVELADAVVRGARVVITDDVVAATKITRMVAAIEAAQ